MQRFGWYQTALLAPLLGPGAGGQSEQAEYFEATTQIDIVVPANEQGEGKSI